MPEASDPLPSSGVGLSPGRRRELEADCERVVLSVYRHLDEFDYARLVELFAPDGVWQREGRELKGRAQILANLEQRPRNQVVRHLITNLIVDIAPPAGARVTGYNTAYRALETAPDVVPVEIDAPLGLWVLRAELVSFRDLWLITDLRQVQQFKFAPRQPGG